MLNLRSPIYNPSVWGYVWGRGWARSTDHPWVPISSLLTHMVYLFPFLSYLASSKSVSAHPSNPDTMTNTAQEATAPLSRKLKLVLHNAKPKTRSKLIGGAGENTRATKLRPKPLEAAFSNFDKCPPEVAGDVISSVAVD